MLFFKVGEAFESDAVNRSRTSIAALMDSRPEHARVRRDGIEEIVDQGKVQSGEYIRVVAGERIHLDGKIIEGTSMLDTSAMTGESVPRDVSPGMEALSGCINVNGILTIQVEKNYGESMVSKILDLVENASSRKSKSEAFISKFARWYTPIVVMSATLVALVPPLLLGGDWSIWFYRALTFLVVSCPCALVISVPLSFFGGLGGMSKAGILLNGSNYLEALARIDTVYFD